ncbi:MAG: hypothetical protein ACTSQO_06800 [Candidatus Helarchaeota archaeon]
MSEIELDDLTELEYITPPIHNLNIILKIVSIEQSKLQPEFNTLVREAILADQTGAIEAVFIGNGKNLQISDVILIKNASIIQIDKHQFKMLVKEEPEIIDTDIPIVNYDFIFNKNEDDLETTFDHDFELVQLIDMKNEGNKYSSRVQVVSEPVLKRKFSDTGIKQWVELFVGDETGRMLLIINDIGAVDLEICDEIEINNALLQYRMTFNGPELALFIDHFNKSVSIIKKLDKIYASKKIINYIEPELNFIEEIDELRRNLHLKCKILSIDPPIKKKIQEEFIDFSIARIGDSTGTILLKLWGIHATKFNSGDVIQIIGAFVSIDKWLTPPQKVLDIENNGRIELISQFTDFKVNKKDFSSLNNEELQDFLDLFEYSSIEDLEFNSKQNFIVKIIEKVAVAYPKYNNNVYKLEKFLIGDETGCIYLNLINNTKQFLPNDVLRLIRFTPKIRGTDICLEKNASSQIFQLPHDHIDNISDEILCIENEFTKIKDLELHGTYNIKCKVINLSPIFSFKDNNNNDHQFRHIELQDDTSSIKLVLFDDDINKIPSHFKDKIIEISQCYVSKYKSNLQLKLSPKYGRIKLLNNTT